VGSRALRRRSIHLVVAVACALAAALFVPNTAGAAKAVKIGNPGPEVPGVGINSKAALAGAACDATAQRIKIVFLTRPPCVTPWKQGANNGGATAPGVSKDSIKVIMYALTNEASAAGPASGRATNRATGAVGDLSQALKDWLAVLQHGEWEMYGRTVDLEIVNPSGTDEAAQRADAVAVVAKKPFFVVDTIGLPVFASAVAGSRVIVQSASGTPDDVQKQAPYRWLGAGDPNGSPFNAGEFVKKSLLGKPAQFGGDDVKTQTRKLGIVYPDTGLDITLFTKQLPKNSYVLASYNVPVDTAQVSSSLQTQAATLIPKLKSEGVTTITLFGALGISSQAIVATPMTSAATAQNYTPEWFLPGTLGIDVSLVARGIDQKQWAHAFGIGQLFPPIVGGALNQNTAYFNWYWGEKGGTYQAAAVGYWSQFFKGVMFAGPKLTAKTFQQGMFSVPATGGAATGNTQNYMTAYGPAAGLPYNEYGGLGYDFYMYWWDPASVGVSNIVATSGTGRYAYLNNALRFASGTWPTGEPKFFDKSVSIYEETSSTTPTAGQATLPAADTLPTYPCTGCPSSGTTAAK
jgi:hypothetical protein